jgi:hypothetical protein
MAQDFESNGAQITNSNTTIFTSNSDDAIVGLRLANILTSTVTGDILKGISSAASSVDVWCSVVDSIST